MSHKILKLVTLFLLFSPPLGNTAPEKNAQTPQATRIISLSPNITEILFSLDLGEQIVGVTNFCRYPPQAREKISVGTLLDPNLELIISLKPDLIILLPPSTDKITTIRKSLNAKLLIVENETVKDVLKSIQTIGQATGRQAEAKKLINSINKQLNKIKKELTHKTKQRVLFVVGRDPDSLKQIYVVGKATFLHEIITLAGGMNIMESAKARYPIVSKEQIIALNPEVIIDASVGENLSEKQKQQNIALWKELETVSAARNEKIYLITDPKITIPSSKIPEHVEYLYNLIYSRDGEKKSLHNQNKQAR